MTTGYDKLMGVGSGGWRGAESFSFVCGSKRLGGRTEKLLLEAKWIPNSLLSPCGHRITPKAHGCSKAVAAWSNRGTRIGAATWLFINLCSQSRFGPSNTMAASAASQSPCC